MISRTESPVLPIIPAFEQQDRDMIAISHGRIASNSKMSDLFVLSSIYLCGRTGFVSFT